MPCGTFMTPVPAVRASCWCSIGLGPKNEDTRDWLSKKTEEAIHTNSLLLFHRSEEQVWAAEICEAFAKSIPQGRIMAMNSHSLILLITSVVIKFLYYKKAIIGTGQSDFGAGSIKSYVNQINFSCHLLMFFRNLTVSIIVWFVWGKRSTPCFHSHHQHTCQLALGNSCFIFCWRIS